MWKRWLSFGIRTTTNRFEQEALQATSATGLLWARPTRLHPIPLGASRPPNGRSYLFPFQAWPIHLLTRATAAYKNGARPLRASSTVDETFPCFGSTRCDGDHYLHPGKPPDHRQRNSSPRNSDRKVVDRLALGVAIVVRQYTVLPSPLLCRPFYSRCAKIYGLILVLVPKIDLIMA